MTQNELLQFQACKEHVEALKLHIMNTQQFLLREADQINVKIGELQVSVVKDVETILASSSAGAIEGRTSALSSISPQRVTGIIDRVAIKHQRHLSQELPATGD